LDWKEKEVGSDRIECVYVCGGRMGKGREGGFTRAHRSIDRDTGAAPYMCQEGKPLITRIGLRVHTHTPASPVPRSSPLTPRPRVMPLELLTNSKYGPGSRTYLALRTCPASCMGPTLAQKTQDGSLQQYS
jgi:hypothetical protein